jgi:hypothetical protein
MQWEYGRHAPDAIKLSLLANIGVDIMYILTGTRTSLAALAQTQLPASGSFAVLSQEEQVLLNSYRQALEPWTTYIAISDVCLAK